MCSGLPEPGLAAALETSGDKAAAAAAAAAISLSWSLWGNSDLPDWKIIRGWTGHGGDRKRDVERGQGEEIGEWQE